MNRQATTRTKIVIIGGGFAGLHAAKALGKLAKKLKPHTALDITVIDRQNHHLFQPLLYQVAMAQLSPRDIAAPLRGILRNQRTTRVLMGEVTNIDVAQQQVALQDGAIIPYDYLILATGASHSYFANPQWEKDAPGLKTLQDAVEIRRRVLTAFERAERLTHPADRAERAALLTFVVVGSGPTGVELAGTLGEMAHLTLRRNFRSIDPASAQILLMDLVDRVLPPYAPDLSAKAEESLRKLGVTVMTSTRVTDITPDSITVEDVSAKSEAPVMRTIPTRTVMWAAGVQASPLGKMLAEQTGAELDRSGRVLVEPDLSLPEHPELFVLGDLAHFAHDDDPKKAGTPLPGLAPVAMQQGDHVAKVIAARLVGTSAPSFSYWDRGTMATIGRNAAVAQIGKLKLSGYFAWLAWVFIHLMYLVGFENRLLTFFQWFWNYITFNRGVRLIIEHNPKSEPVARKTPVATKAPAAKAPAA